MLARYFRPRQFRQVIGQVSVISRDFSDSSKGKRTLKPLKRRPASPAAPAPAPLAVHDAWTEVVDKQSGQIYYWNTVTDETTPLGAPKPTGASGNDLAPQQPQQSGGMMSGLGRVVAEGFAFGVGSSVAHGIVGSMFGGGHDSGGGDASSGGDDSFDI
jgi:hypothetical protein